MNQTKRRIAECRLTTPIGPSQHRVLKTINTYLIMRHCS
ncbi:hypothetical protein H5410_002175 [Solanum commersonii]|uniref:Uncharacterized protein n=1 Tax=Solanum commersonii TaxID=4109 RepID=A0A9J6B1K4_SOLCO|nr:hypothetical protein H5410_002175 [Solanum commersonii]